MDLTAQPPGTQYPANCGRCGTYGHTAIDCPHRPSHPLQRVLQLRAEAPALGVAEAIPPVATRATTKLAATSPMLTTAFIPLATPMLAPPSIPSAPDHSFLCPRPPL